MWSEWKDPFASVGRSDDGIAEFVVVVVVVFVVAKDRRPRP